MPLDFPSSPTNGQVYDQWQWDGSKWVAIVGTLPAGPAGPTGATGATGSQGATGPQGDVGPQGPQGIPGVGSVSGLTAGQIPIAASATAISSSANLSGDVTSAPTTLATTLATVNGNVGTFQGLTVNAKGLVTAAVDQSYAPLASPAFSGTPSLPTGTTGITQTAATSNTTLATTAYVKANVPVPLTVVLGGTGDTGTAWTAYTPTVTAGAGTFTTASATGRYKLIGKTCFITISVSITTVGSASSSAIATLPGGITASPNTMLSGREMLVAGKALSGTLGAGAAFVTIVNYDNTFPGVAGSLLVVSGVFETA